MTVTLVSAHGSNSTNGTSPAPLGPQHAAISPTAKVSSAPDQARHRQHFSTPTTPGGESSLNYDIKDTQHVSLAYDHTAYPSTTTTTSTRPSTFRNRSPSAYKHTDGPTLSSFLTNAFATAKHSLDSSAITNGGIANGTHGSTSNSTLWSSAIRSKDTLQANVGFIALCGLWYLSSAFSSNTGKSIMTRFRYPVTLTFIQFAFVAGYCVLFLAVREQTTSVTHAPSHSPHSRRGSLSTLHGWGIRKPSRSMFQGTFVMSLFQIAGHVFSSMAIARVPVSTVHTIKALSPLFTVISYAALFGVRYGTSTYIALLPLTVGVMLACSFDLRANAVGFLCALGSTVIFVSQNIFSKRLLPKESSTGATAPSLSGGSAGAKQLDKLNLLFYSSGMAFFLMIPIWLYSDAGTLLNAWMDPETDSTSASGSIGSLIFTFFLNGSVHFGQNLLAFSILARTSPVTYSIASLIKRIAVICIAIVWSGQKVSFIQACGMTMTFTGLWMYNSAKSDVDKGERKRGALEKRQEMFLPSTAADVRELEGSTPPPQESYRPAYAGMSEAAAPPSMSAPRNRSTLGNHMHFAPPPPPLPIPPPPPAPHANIPIENGHGHGPATMHHR